MKWLPTKLEKRARHPLTKEKRARHPFTKLEKRAGIGCDIRNIRDPREPWMSERGGAASEAEPGLAEPSGFRMLERVEARALTKGILRNRQAVVT